ncbi:MAG TPA: pyridoxamine 5'-phosphate oxidase [Mycobacteriales bacterium]|nr:pyridoxamine 5'-phosphate oxidase [Mycobacteriales bacterium]
MEPDASGRQAAHHPNDDSAELAERLRSMRRSYHNTTLSEADLAPRWVEQFDAWMRAATESLVFPEPNAMVVATASPAALPSVRTVLLRSYDENGFVFYTNYRSRKGREIAGNPHVSCLFPWYALERQVIVTGSVERISRAESEAYFHSRPHGSQLASSISNQSAVVADRAQLQDEFARLEEQYPEGTQVPLPDFWGGFRVVPDSVEFWQGRLNRLHDRLRYRLAEGVWVVERLAP